METDAPPRAAQRPDTIYGRTQLFARAAQLVEREHASPVEMDDLARRLSTSRRQLQRAFREIGGTTFRKHLANVRMAHAAELLGDPSLTVGAVARAVGYRQQAQFAKSFRERFGSTPSDYRVELIGRRRGSGQARVGEPRETVRRAVVATTRERTPA
jgi:AraC family transcriptional regulator, regulatory protein of adaptative response / methylphosphotriester-DNA alkyltransferase methyltransferase